MRAHSSPSIPPPRRDPCARSPRDVPSFLHLGELLGGTFVLRGVVPLRFDLAPGVDECIGLALGVLVSFDHRFDDSIFIVIGIVIHLLEDLVENGHALIGTTIRFLDLLDFAGGNNWTTGP